MKKIIISLFLFAGFFPGSFAQTAFKLPDDVEANIKKRIAYEQSPSIVVGIINKEGARYFNFGNVKMNGALANEHSIYEIGSISKVFTAILLAQQILDGKVKLDDPAQKYLPKEVKVPQRAGKEIALANLSDHTSGLPRMPSNFAPVDLGNPFADYTVEQLYSFLSGYELTRDIGSAYEYSNLAQGLLGHILALNAGISYEALMIKTIASSLQMKETKITFDDIMKKNLATGYSNGVAVENWEIPTLAGAGAIRSSTYDMLKFLAANLGLTKSPLQAAMNMTHQVRHEKAGNMRVGLAWHIAKGKNGDVIWHNGGTGGYRTFAGFVKETSMGVVVLTNSSAGADDIGFHLLNPDSPLSEPKASIVRAMRKEIDTKGAEAGVALYQELKKSTVGYDFGENVLNTLGYSYLDKNLPAALALLKLNVDLFPTSSNVYDSYAEALVKNNQKDLAIENYKKSVELNPGNAGAIKALETLGVKFQPADADVPESILETYVGTYSLSPAFNIEVTRSGKQLFAQATNQSKFEIFAKSTTEFYLKVVAASITFNTNGTQVESLTLHQNGQNVPGKKIK
ncbi:MAG TPA: serine hydrolase [Chryseolinea sp.]|nr:serine hydrolase [Chryseolinea sp.]